MPGFRVAEGYVPGALSAEDEALFSQDAVTQLEWEEVSEQHEALRSAQQAKQALYVASFLEKNASALTALSTVLEDVPQRNRAPTLKVLPHTLEEVMSRLKENPTTDIEMIVRLFLSRYVSFDDADLFIKEGENLVDTTIVNETEQRQRHAARQIAACFKQLIDEVRLQKQPVFDVLRDSNDIGAKKLRIMCGKSKNRKQLYQTLHASLTHLRNHQITPLAQQRTAEGSSILANTLSARALCDECITRVGIEVRGEYARAEERMDDYISQFKTKLFALEQVAQNDFDTGLIDLLKRMRSMVLAHQENFKKVSSDISEEVEQLKAQKKQVGALFADLKAAIQRLQHVLPDGEQSFQPVLQTCDVLLTVLNTKPVVLGQTRTNLKRLLDGMRTVDLYKSWSECEGISEVASYVMYVLESAVRWLLECIHICSSTPEARITRENYFFKGPKKLIFEAFNAAQNDLNAIEKKLCDDMPCIEVLPEYSL
ncbi:MAG: hypothetical protein P1U61_00315 [Legionellaceae bacterium]|nr:hypothetical protein [Legionellaceae bacterium]